MYKGQRLMICKMSVDKTVYLVNDCKNIMLIMIE